MQFMAWRIGLGVLQALGALSIVAYPAALTASVMAIGGEGPRGLQRIVVSIPYVLLALYPAAWIALFVWAWRLLGGGLIGPAYAVSLVPALVSLAAMKFLLSPDAPTKPRRPAQIEQVNPLVSKILAAGDSSSMPVAGVLKAVQESDRVNVPVPGLGTPLKVALRNLKYNFDGTPYDRRQEELRLIVQALLARGAALAHEEAEDWDVAWRLRRVTFEGPITTREENPLVWRLLEMADPKGPYIRDGKEFDLTPADFHLLNVPTRLHGTPLYLALRLRAKRVCVALAKAGARLSSEEESEPAAAAALRKFFEEYPDLR